MDLIDFKEKISRTRCFFDGIRYKRGKHLYLAIFFMVFLMVASFLCVFFFQKQQINIKENILKSYYADAGNNKSEVSGGLNTADVSDNTLANESASGDAKSGNGSDGIEVRNGDKTSDSVSAGDTTITENTEVYIIKVYICGQVKSPGVYDIENSSRLVDLVALAGGATDEACLEAINLAQILNDSQMFYIPSMDEVKNGSIPYNGDWNTGSSSGSDLSSDTAGSQSFQNKLININFASLSELVQLPGIGTVTAQNIIDYRNKYGQFKNKEELKNVKGIGEKKYEKIKDLISF